METCVDYYQSVTYMNASFLVNPIGRIFKSIIEPALNLGGAKSDLN